MEADVATYQITCGLSGNYQPFSTSVIGYSSIGWVNDPTNFGFLNNTNFKGANIYAIVYAIALSNNVNGFPLWQIILSKDVGNAITLETLNVKVTIPKAGTENGRTIYTLMYTKIEPPWVDNKTYTLKLYL